MKILVTGARGMLGQDVMSEAVARRYMVKAARPLNSRLEKRMLTEAGFSPLPDWRDALKRYLWQRKS